MSNIVKHRAHLAGKKHVRIMKKKNMGKTKIDAHMSKPTHTAKASTTTFQYSRVHAREKAGVTTGDEAEVALAHQPAVAEKVKKKITRKKNTFKVSNPTNATNVPKTAFKYSRVPKRVCRGDMGEKAGVTAVDANDGSNEAEAALAHQPSPPPPPPPAEKAAKKITRKTISHKVSKPTNATNALKSAFKYSRVPKRMCRGDMGEKAIVTAVDVNDGSNEAEAALAHQPSPPSPPAEKEAKKITTQTITPKVSKTTTAKASKTTIAIPSTPNSTDIPADVAKKPTADTADKTARGLMNIMRGCNVSKKGMRAISKRGAVSTVLSAMRAHPNDEGIDGVQCVGLLALEALVDGRWGRHDSNWQAAVAGGAAEVIETACLCMVREDPFDSSGRRTTYDLSGARKEVRRCHLGMTPILYELLTPEIRSTLPGKCLAVQQAASSSSSSNGKAKATASHSASAAAGVRRRGRSSPTATASSGDKIKAIKETKRRMRDGGDDLQIPTTSDDDPGPPITKADFDDIWNRTGPELAALAEQAAANQNIELAMHYGTAASRLASVAGSRSMSKFRLTRRVEERMMHLSSVGFTAMSESEINDANVLRFLKVIERTNRILDPNSWDCPDDLYQHPGFESTYGQMLTDQLMAGAAVPPSGAPTATGPHCAYPGCGVYLRNGSKKRCGRCRRVYYCGRTCQRAHWKAHKPSCHSPENAATTSASRDSANASATVSSDPSGSAANGGGGGASTVPTPDVVVDISHGLMLSALQRCVDQAPSGTVVRIPEGEWSSDNAVGLVIKSAITLEGSGYDTVLNFPVTVDPCVEGKLLKLSCFTVKNAQMKIAGKNIDQVWLKRVQTSLDPRTGNDALVLNRTSTNRAAKILVEDCKVIGGSDGLGIYASNKVHLKKCQILNSGNRGIFANPCFTIEDSVVRGHASYGMKTRGGCMRVGSNDIQPGPWDGGGGYGDMMGGMDGYGDMMGGMW